MPIVPSRRSCSAKCAARTSFASEPNPPPPPPPLASGAMLPRTMTLGNARAPLPSNWFVVKACPDVPAVFLSALKRPPFLARYAASAAALREWP